MVKRDWNLIIGWSSAHLFIVVILAIPAISLLLITLPLGFSAFFKTVGTIASLALVPYIVQLYPLPHNNNFYAEQLRQPWLPAETITLASHRYITGYTLSSDSDWLVVLLAGNRQIVYYLSAEVARRQVCQIGKAGPVRPLVTLVPAATHVPLCRQSTPGAPSPAAPSGLAGRLPVGCPPTLLHAVTPIGIRAARCT